MAQLQTLRLRVPAITTAERLSFAYPGKPDTEFYNLFFSGADYIELKSKMYRVENLEATIKSTQRVKLHDVVGHFKGL
jgi:hypothetical protein